MIMLINSYLTTNGNPDNASFSTENDVQCSSNGEDAKAQALRNSYTSFVNFYLPKLQSRRQSSETSIVSFKMFLINEMNDIYVLTSISVT